MLVEFIGELENTPMAMTDGAAGMDVRALQETVLPPKTITLVKTGVKLQIVEGESGVSIMNIPRSSICKKGLLLSNSIGLIDPDYQGDIGFQFLNYTEEPIVLPKGERIGQIIFNKMVMPDEILFKLVDEFSSKTERGEGAFGHTGKD